MPTAVNAALLLCLVAILELILEKIHRSAGGRVTMLDSSRSSSNVAMCLSIDLFSPMFSPSTSNAGLIFFEVEKKKKNGTRRNVRKIWTEEVPRTGRGRGR